MSLEITLRVNGVANAHNTQDHLSERLVKLLRELDGVLDAHYDSKSCRFAVRYNPNRITILRILSRIELAGRRTGVDYRPTDVQTSHEDSSASPSPLPEPEEAVHSAPAERP
jgi:hypothetical protein